MCEPFVIKKVHDLLMVYYVIFCLFFFNYILLSALYPIRYLIVSSRYLFIDRRKKKKLPRFKSRIKPFPKPGEISKWVVFILGLEENVGVKDKSHFYAPVKAISFAYLSMDFGFIPDNCHISR